jgi:hypothetical protein
MARGLWKGAISFGLVNVPVELHSAKKRSTELDVTMLDKRDLAPVGYRRVNKSTGKEVPWADVVKGYEYEDDKYVVLSDEDFRRANGDPHQAVPGGAGGAGRHPGAEHASLARRAEGPLGAQGAGGQGFDKGARRALRRSPRSAPRKSGAPHERKRHA